MLDLLQGLQRQRKQNLYRTRRILTSAQGVEVVVDGKTSISFCSNDYLGLANDTRIKDAMRAGIASYGVGAGASHLVSGHFEAHHELELALAKFVGAPRALLFSTGYMANLSVVSALLARRDHVFADRLSHASLLDAAQVTQAQLRRYRHLDQSHLESLLRQCDKERMIVTDGVFSMDGDCADIGALLKLAKHHHARLLVDDAHGIGVLGERGRGSFAAQGVMLQSPAILLGTLGKAFGTFGAFVAGEEELIETLIQSARPYIYTTALPPAVAVATRASLDIVCEEQWRRDELFDRVRQFRTGAAQLGLSLLPSHTPIQAIVLGDAQAALAASTYLSAREILVPAIRPPTVPKGSARLRITFSALHTSAHVERLLCALDEWQRAEPDQAAKAALPQV